MTLTPLILHDQKCHVVLLSWTNKCSGAIDNAISITWYWQQCQLCHMTRNSCIPFPLSWPKNAILLLMMPLTLHNTDAIPNDITLPKMSCCTSFWYSWHKEVMVPLTMPLASHDASTSFNGHITHYFSCLGLMNVMVPLVMLLVPCDANMDANCITSLDQKSHDASHVHHLDLNICNGAMNAAISIKWCWPDVTHVFNCLDLMNAMVPLMMLLVLCDANTNANGITWPKRSCYAS